MQSVWQELIDMAPDYGELAIYNDFGPTSYRCKVSKIVQLEHPAQAEIKSEWMAGRNLANGMPWTKFGPELPRTVGLMIVTGPSKLLSDEGIAFRAMALDTKANSLLPRDIFRCILFAPGENTTDFAGREGETYDPYSSIQN